MVSLRKRKRMRLFSGESNALVPLPSFWDKEISPQDPNRMPSNDVIQPERMKETKKPRIKTFAKKSPTKKKKDYLQYRCNMMGFADAMQLYKPTIQQRQDICDELAKTPFWSLLKVYMDDILIATDRKKKSGMDLIKIMQCYNSKEQKFKFGDNEAKGITNDDVVQIFGLNNRGVELPNTDKSTKHGKEDPFVDKYFKHAKVVKRKQLIEAYEKSLLDQSPQGAKDTTSIICAHLIQSLLFANSGTYITWSFLKICGELDEISKYNWAKGVKDYLLKMINKAQKKKKDRGEEPTISGCTVFVLYWICLHTNVVKTVKGRENMIPAIARWDTSMIHKAIKDVPVEQIKIDGVIPCAQPQEESSKKKEEKSRTKKRKQSDVIPYAQPEDDELDDHSHQKEEANKDEMAEVDKNLKKKKNKQKRKQNDEEHESININEAQAQFDQLYKEEMSKLDAIHQRYIVGMDRTLSVDLFNEFKSARSIDQKRYLTFKTMMAYALDSSNKECVALRESNKMLNHEMKKILRQEELDKKKVNALNADTLSLQTKNSAASLKINEQLNEIGALKKKLEEKETKMPGLNASVHELQEECNQTASDSKVQSPLGDEIIKKANFPIPHSLSDEIAELEASKGAESSADSKQISKAISPVNSTAASEDMSAEGKVKVVDITNTSET
ncbi:unnamed protein product [Malus baccata var. baccata]